MTADWVASPTVSVAAASELSPSERRDIVDLCGRAFREDFGTLFEILPGSIHVLVRVDGMAVSHACWVSRWLQPGSHPPLRTAYVEAVATEPALQGRGYGTIAMRRLAAEIQDYELAGLATGSPGFYARLGWELWRGLSAIRTPSGLLDTTGERIMILRTPLTPPLDVTALLTAEWREGELW